MSRPGLILKLSCPDQPGIVAKIANYAAGHRGNLIEFNQFSDQLGRKFFARLEIETADLDVDVQDFIDGFGTLGRSLQANSPSKSPPSSATARIAGPMPIMPESLSIRSTWMVKRGPPASPKSDV